MKTRQLPTFALAGALLFTAALPVTSVGPQMAALMPVAALSAAENNNVRNTPAMREGTYRRFGRVRELADQGEMKRAFEALRSMSLNSLNSYEKAMYWNLAAFLHYQEEDLAATARAYEKLLEQSELPLSLEQDTRFSLAKVYNAREEYPKALKALEGWFAMQDDPGADAFALKSQLHYSQSQWAPAAKAIDRAIELRRKDGREVAENWYLLKRGIHYQQEDYTALKDVLEVLVKEYTKKDYLMQLSAVYGELDRPKEQLAVREAAYEKGYLEKSNEQISLAQMMASQNSPFKAARVIDKGLESGQVEDSAKNVKRMGDYYLMAKEYDRALTAFARAAEKQKDGEIHLRMSQVALERGDFQDAVEYASEAIRRGGFDNMGRAHMVKGLAHFNLENYSQSLSALDQARKLDGTGNSAQQWFDYVSREKDRKEALEASAQPVEDPGA
ncbi:MAG: tetratricopeptide repeat protein [Oleiphilaceae bacterium]|nr:tetratricopeptide repeat protein [Oleiphilaceae bacterium]